MKKLNLVYLPFFLTSQTSERIDERKAEGRDRNGYQTDGKRMSKGWQKDKSFGKKDALKDNQ